MLRRPTSLPAELASPQKAPRTRDPWLDNVRLVAAILIAVGHFTTPFLKSNNEWVWLWVTLWGFRLPVFVIVAGYFTYTARYSLDKVIAVFRDVALVYVIFQAIASLLAFANTGNWKFDLGSPHMALWFLPALVIWRLLAPLLVRIPHYVIVTTVACLALSTLPYEEQWIARTVAYLPLFVLGVALRGAGLHARLNKPNVRLWAWALILAWFAASLIARAADVKYKRGPFLMRSGLDGEGWELVVELAQRAAILGLGAVLGLSLIAIVPRKRIPVFSALGAGSFTIYLVHPLIYKQLNYWEIYEDYIDSRFDRLFLVFAVVALALALGSAPVRKATRWLTTPKTLIDAVTLRFRAMRAVKSGGQTVPARPVVRKTANATLLSPVETSATSRRPEPKREGADA